MSTCRLCYVFILCILGCFFLNANAAAIFKDSPLFTDSKNAWFVGVGGGKAFSHLSKSSVSIANGSGYDPPYDSDLYTINRNHSTGLLQFLMGYRFHREAVFLPYISTFFQYQYYFSSNIKGTVEQYSLPEFLNYNYVQSYDTNQYMLMGKFDLFQVWKVLPYISGGVGVVSSSLDTYNETALPGVTARTNPAYRANTISQAAYTLGVGLDFIVTDHIWMTLGYEHLFPHRIASADQITSADAMGSWSGTRLNYGNLSSNIVFLNITTKISQDMWS